MISLYFTFFSSSSWSLMILLWSLLKICSLTLICEKVSELCVALFRIEVALVLNGWLIFCCSSERVGFQLCNLNFSNMEAILHRIKVIK